MWAEIVYVINSWSRELEAQFLILSKICIVKKTSKVKFSGVLSNNYECTLGVWQEESLSPFLFNLVPNDIEVELESGGFGGASMPDITIKTLLSADDLLLTSDSTEGLELGIDILYDYCTQWKLIMNIEKSAVVIFRKGGSLLRYDEKCLEPVNN